MPDITDKIVIIGAGCFGVSTAYHLLERGFTDITVLDRSPVLPAPDAASNDINRIVRSSYSDIFYSRLAREAISAWKDREIWRDTYRESGVLVLGFTNDAYADKAYQNDIDLGATLNRLQDAEAIRNVFSPDVPTASFENNSGYLNKEGGWADAGQGLSIMLEMIISLGCKVLSGKPVKCVVRDVAGKTNGVQCEDGSIYKASTVIIATGSWTPATFPDDTAGHTSGLSTGGGRQCVAMLQLSEEEAQIYKDIPVILDLYPETGFYLFPPTDKGIIKMAMHLAGYTHMASGISRPRTVTDDPVNGLAIPKDNVYQLRAQLRKYLPKLAEKPFCNTRLCWYNDSPDGDWIIGRVPGDPSLILATAGSGHAYKFLPVLGRLVADTFEGTLDPNLAAKFALQRPYHGVDGSRTGMAVRELNLEQLCTQDDLRAYSNET
ncbi:hypothetical protein H0H93_015337 [Arthromyces matolae]|nr:hypothetical protein H0H93_015337 [Arthromyces matolae]